MAEDAPIEPAAHYDRAPSSYTFQRRSTVRTHTLQLAAVTKLIDRFMLDNLQEFVERDHIQRVTAKITKYFGNVLLNYDPDQATEIVDCVVENFLSLIPPSWSRYLPPASIALLFERVLGKFQSKEDTDPGELVYSIVTLARDAMMETNVVDSRRNLTQQLLCEVVKEMIVSMHLEDVLSTDTMAQLIVMFGETDGIVARCVNRFEFVEEVMKHAVANFVDELEAHMLVDFADRFVDGVLKVVGK